MGLIDIRTLFIIVIVLMTFYGVGMFAFAHEMRKSFKGIQLFAIINILIAVAILSAFLRNLNYINVDLSVVLTNSLLIISSNLIYYAHLQFMGCKLNFIGWSLFILSSVIILIIIFTYIAPSMNNRIIVLSSFYGIQFFSTAKVVWQFQRKARQTFYMPLVLISAAYAAFFFLRVIYTVFYEKNVYDIHTLSNNNIFLIIQIIILMLYLVALNFFIILISTVQLVKKVTELSHRDPLTQLYNRRGLDYALQNRNIFTMPLSVIICDIDHFKATNDRYGHAIGDIVIQTFARIVTAITRESDICTRWGGEEFLIILPLANEQEALIVAEKVRIACEQQSFSEQQDLSFTSSFGICSKKDNYSFDELINNADYALYQAKNQGRNQVCIFSEAI